MGISTHVLDTSRGCPVSGMSVTLDRLEASGWRVLNESRTDTDGRVPDLVSRERAPEPGVYRLRFATRVYFEDEGAAGLYPTVEICFEVRTGERHCHLPLLLAANGYTTYRGS